MTSFRFLLGVFLLCLVAENAQAQDLQIPLPDCQGKGLSPKWWENRQWMEPLAASRHEAQSSLFFGKSKPFPYMTKQGTHDIMEPSLGWEMPIVAWDGFEDQPGSEDDTARDIAIPTKCWGFGIWLGTGFHTALDFDEDGQPVVDTDFKVAIMAKAAYGLSDRTRFDFRFQVCHESSHLTIDFAKGAEAAFGEKFKNVDVNYECYETSANVDRMHSWGTLSIRGGAMFAMGRGHPGFYSTPGTLVPSRRNWEPYVGLQYVPRKASGWGPLVSYSAYGLTTYDFDRTSPDELEAMRVSQTLVLGFHNFGKDRGVPDFVLRCYTGRNPYGPLRNQNSWNTCGMGMIIR
ncbi:hypothetical protein A2818_01250 [Candidatus Nomurabacteria bacterium RIFCSPHIGHO2_01_FULL_40_12]|uniref:DUF1207 domain-containing protein n=1 Tax=Candidatus Nomurabacteria bacterium RIFCSPHIGHO2_01_FULL_40_12 TaxID=1801737 RepID=A0A1F6V117_9BACT|nr:MAG: hypothetical protein A2818_01250 [Candidatus Nomurabacteria bacterium RIFCSPHIGHO2_01_FULL_40_12]